MADPRMRVGDIQEEPGASVEEDSKEVLKQTNKQNKEKAARWTYVKEKKEPNTRASNGQR